MKRDVLCQSEVISMAILLPIFLFGQEYSVRLHLGSSLLSSCILRAFKTERITSFRSGRDISRPYSLQFTVHKNAIASAPNQTGNWSKCKWVFFFIMISQQACSAWLYLNMNPWRWLLPPWNLRGFQHHILTAISGTICFLLADITRLWTDLTLKWYNVLYILILFNCGEGDVHRTQPTKSTVLF